MKSGDHATDTADIRQRIDKLVAAIRATDPEGVAVSISSPLERLPGDEGSDGDDFNAEMSSREANR